MTKMISHFKPFLVLFLISILLKPAFGQEAFTGQVVYHISYEGSLIDLPEQQQLPTQVVIMARKHLVRSEMIAPQLRQVKIADAEEKTTTTLLEIYDHKYAIVKSSGEIEEQLAEMPEVEFIFTDEREMILGYECRKALAITYDAQGMKHTSEIFYTEQLEGYPLQFDTPYREIPGLMLRYELRAGPLVMHYQATAIEEKWMVGGSHFKIPSDYQLITYQELRQKLSGDL
ncbi:MAG: hypothetical protein R6U64_09475 [Bacteroidales bacterium]